MEEAQLGKRRGRSAFAPPPLALDSLPLETRRRRDAARVGGTGSSDPATGSAEPSSMCDKSARMLPVRALPCMHALRSQPAVCAEVHVRPGAGPSSLANSVRACAGECRSARARVAWPVVAARWLTCQCFFKGTAL